MEDQKKYLQTSAIGVASYELVMTLIGVLAEKGIITLDEIADLIQDKLNDEPAAPTTSSPAELSSNEVRRVYESTLRALNTIKEMNSEKK